MYISNIVQHIGVFMESKMKLLAILIISSVFGFLMMSCSLDEGEVFLKVINQNDEPIVLVDIGDNRWDNLNIADSKDFTIPIAGNTDYWIDIVYGNSNLRQIFVPFYKGKTEVVILTANGDLVLYPTSIKGEPLID